jgi:cold shock CspA family protein
MQGSIDKIIHSHGFGFIRSTGGRKVFFHRADLLGLDFHRLREGQNVEFYLPWKCGEDMPQAVVVRPPVTQPSPRHSIRSRSISAAFASALRRTLPRRTTARRSGI